MPVTRCQSCNRFFPRQLLEAAKARELTEVHSGYGGIESLSKSGGHLLYMSGLASAEVTPYPGSQRLAVSSTMPTECVDLNSHNFVRNTPAVTLLPTIPGFQIDRVIGRGGMGTVYLARQLSLDRPVALKVMSRAWVNDPVFVARFTREAYAAAQLNHPNLVQVYDIGESEGMRFFSMEYVQGRTLADAIRYDGKIDPESAVGYTLQAARGLKHAHDRGMIHRDIKPDNLLIDEHGLVKVADLGLVKTPDLSRDADKVDSDAASLSGLHSLPPDMTGVRIALGTPAYMSPEQCRDAASVDHRADIYSLGCTLYVMVTGQPPFQGDTAVELMTAHAYQHLIPPEEIANRVPKELSSVIQRMMAKHPSERFQTMADVIRTLEQWLGVHHTGQVSAREEQIAALEDCVDQYIGAPAAVLRSRAITGFLTACLISTIILTLVGRLEWAFGIAGMVIQLAGIYFLINGLTQKTHLFRRLRQFVMGLSVGDWLIVAATVVMFAIFLWMLKLFWVWIGFGLIAAGLAFALRLSLDRTVAAERRVALAGCERLLRRMRVLGMDEDQLRQFVAKYAGRMWEEFFEELFGYEAKIAARNKLLRGEHAGRREKFAVWREPILNLLDRADQSRQATKERKLLIQVETDRLVSTGLTIRAARHAATEVANAMVRQADAIRSAENKQKDAPRSRTIPNVHRLIHQAGKPTIPSGDKLRNTLLLVLGPYVRGVMATVFLSGCVAWSIQNHVISISRILGETAAIQYHPLTIPEVPSFLTNWCDTATVGWAGVLLLTSMFYRGVRMSLLVVLGAAVTVAAHKLVAIPDVEPIRDFHVGAMLGTVFALVGYRFGRR